MSVKNDLLERIESRQAVVGVVGMGYVGLPLAVALTNVGFHVTGIDVDPEKVACLNRGVSYVEDVSSEELGPLVKKGLLRASTDYADLAHVDAISICVPTPLRKTKDPDISYIINAAENIVRYGGSGKLVILESTT